MSLLGLGYSFVSVHVVSENLSILVKASASQREDWRLSDEEIIPQIR